MTPYERAMLAIVSEYRLAGGPWPASSQEMADWALRTGRWQLPPSAASKVCAEDLSRAMREEYMTDAKGRRVRVKHPATLRRSGEQTTLWDDIRTASRAHMEVAFAQRRNAIVGDCKQLKADVDCYNDRNPASPPIQLVLDFTRDVQEWERHRAA